MAKEIRVTYAKLRELLIKRNIQKQILMQEAGVSSPAFAKITKDKQGKDVNVKTIAKICKYLNVGFDDVMEIEEVEEPEN